MKKAIISVFVIVTFVIYSIHTRNESNTAVVTAPTSLPTTPFSGSSTAGSPPAASHTPRYNDGTYTGIPTDAYYGYIQVKVIVSGGVMTDIQFLQYPKDRLESMEINSQAMPMLKQEAIQAQSAQIDGVSGATDTTQAFIESLNSALNKAKV